MWILILCWLFDSMEPAKIDWGTVIEQAVEQATEKANEELADEIDCIIRGGNYECY